MPNSSEAVPTADRRLPAGERVVAAGVVQLVVVVALGVLGPIAPTYGLLGAGRGEALWWGTIVLGDVVPTVLGIELVLLASGCLTVLVGVCLPWTQRTPSTTRSVVSGVAGLALAICVVCSVFFSLVFAFSAYQVLPGASDSGCRLVVRESAFLLLADGAIGVLRPGSAVVEWQEDYSADDGHAPFSADDYELHWRGEVAQLRLGTKRIQPVWLEGDGLLDCSR